MEDIRRNIAELFGDAGYISLDILDRIIYSQNHSVRGNARENRMEYISLVMLDRPFDLEKHSAKEKNSGKLQDEDYISLSLLDKKPQKQKCEHLSTALDCFAGGFGRMSCFDNDFHETCPFKAKHRKMVAEKEQIRKNMEKLERA